jgi:N-acetylmuramoyl-L-alanine amidase
VLAVAIVLPFALVRPAARASVASPMIETRTYTIVIDPGHGGRDPGYVARDHTTEKSLNLAIANRVAARLFSLRDLAVLTRTGDSFLDDRQRPVIANGELADCVISLHCARLSGNDTPSGTVVFYHQGSAAGKKLATMLSSAVARLSDLPSRGVRPDTTTSFTGFDLLRDSRAPAALILCGNMENPADLAKLRNPHFQQRLADAIAKGLTAFLGCPHQP